MFSLNIIVTTEMFYQLLCDLKPRPCPLARACAISTIEAIEDVLQVSRLHADAGVTHTQRCLPIYPLKRDYHAPGFLFAAYWRVLECIIEEDERHTTQAFLVTAHAHWLNMADLQIQLRSLRAQSPAQLTQQLEHLVIQLYGRFVLFAPLCRNSCFMYFERGILAGIGSSQEQQLFHQSRQSERLFVYISEHSAPLLGWQFIQMTLQEGQVALNRGEWGTQLVRSVIDKAAVGLCCALQEGKHLGERIHHLRHLVVPTRTGYTLAQVAEARAACRGGGNGSRGRHWSSQRQEHAI